ncbi:MAG TPA: serine hydrolase, partial [Candidatus Obscuribacterales bacterium]
PKGKRRRFRFFKHLPPGQRLLLYMVLPALSGVVTSSSVPAGKSDATGVIRVSNVEPFSLAYRMDVLEDELRKASDKKRLRAGVFAVEPKSGRYVELDARAPYSAASIIKVPVFVSLLVALDRGELKPTDLLTIRQDLITGGSGYLQWRPVDSKLSVKDTAELMIVISDNTATNMLIDALGGREKLNNQFKSWGLKHTRLNNMLADLEGTNTTSPFELAYLMGRIDNGELISDQSREWMYNVMKRTRTRTLLPQGIGPGAKIFHKTGDIGRMVGDAGIVEAPNGHRFIVAVQVERPHNDRRANEMIRSLSKLIYKSFCQDSATDGSMIESATHSPAR